MNQATFAYANVSARSPSFHHSNESGSVTAIIDQITIIPLAQTLSDAVKVTYHARLLPRRRACLIRKDTWRRHQPIHFPTPTGFIERNSCSTAERHLKSASMHSGISKTSGERPHCSSSS
jgi:hypothetical protein